MTKYKNEEQTEMKTISFNYWIIQTLNDKTTKQYQNHTPGWYC